MTKTAQHEEWNSGIRRRVASAALTLVVALALSVLTTQLAQAQAYKESVLYSFSERTHGADPAGGLIWDAKGNRYGTTWSGGDLSGCGGYGCGVVYKLSSKGQETVLYSFTGGADGSNPSYGSLILDANGNLYGATWYGGTGRDCIGQFYPGCGVVFKVNPKDKTETVLYNFTGGADGANPAQGLIWDAKGNLYGTTNSGGLLNVNAGVVFKVSPKDKTETVLYTFTGGADGASPFAGLIWDAKGNLYGAARWAGGSNAGVVFKVSPKDKTETVLYNFTGGADGANPSAGLIWDAKGNLYGTTPYGGDLRGCGGGCGVVFKLSSKGQETVLHRFTGGADGANPSYGSLILDANGNLYGGTEFGGDLSGCGGYGCGVVFKLSSKSQETVLHTFTGGADGRDPSYGSLILDAEGNLYGTTQYGGKNLSGCLGNGCGVVFKLSKR